MVGKVNEELNAVPENLAVRISTGPRYCSGMLVAPDLNASDEPVSTPLVLTCAHYFRTAPLNSFNIRGRGFRGKLDAVRVINGTDIAIARLRRSAPPRKLLGVGSQFFYPGMKTATYGFGGNATEVNTKPGTVLFPTPLSISRGGGTRVRPAAVQLNSPKAIKGDSGGAVLVSGYKDGRPRINAVQSLILDPFGINFGLATVAPIRPHIVPLRRAADSLMAMPRS
jgi:hypothetical protein